MRVKLVDDVPKIIHTVDVLEFAISDVEDPDIWASESFLKWEYSECGKWVMQHALDKPVWHRFFDVSRYSHRYVVRAELYEEDVVYYKLKWS